MQYFQTDSSGFFAGAFDADESPLEPGVFLIPSGGVTVAPPSVLPGQIAKWNGIGWDIYPDTFGQVFWFADGSEHVMTVHGVPLPDGALTVKPAVDDSQPAEIPPTLDEVKATMIRQIERSRDAETVKDVTANGTQWQADERSQKLLNSAITLAGAGLPLPAVWRDSFNNDMAITGLADLLAIAGAMAVQTQLAYSKSWELKTQIIAAASVTEVAAITW